MAQQLGENITVEVKDGKAIITIDLAHRGKPSSSGKSIIVASTGGNQAIPGTDVILGLNAYVKKEGKDKVTQDIDPASETWFLSTFSAEQKAIAAGQTSIRDSRSINHPG